jgi:antibiotic biosynthesis monooxygenase (ABM) superfamily enzyme
MRERTKDLRYNLSFMNRRTSLAVIAVSTAFSLEGAMAEPIQLHVDLEVAPAKEADLVKNYKTIFRPTIQKQPGFVDVRLLKIRKPEASQSMHYRLLISFQTEEHRQQWVASADHQKVWPEIEKNLTGKKFAAVLYDIQ